MDAVTFSICIVLILALIILSENLTKITEFFKALSEEHTRREQIRAQAAKERSEAEHRYMIERIKAENEVRLWYNKSSQG